MRSKKILSREEGSTYVAFLSVGSDESNSKLEEEVEPGEKDRVGGYCCCCCGRGGNDCCWHYVVIFVIVVFFG